MRDSMNNKSVWIKRLSSSKIAAFLSIHMEQCLYIKVHSFIIYIKRYLGNVRNRLDHREKSGQEIKKVTMIS